MKEKVIIMGVKSIVDVVKKIHREYVVLVKEGSFYHVYGRDAYIISYLFRYKIKEIEGIKACGFPKNSINKVISKLETNKLNYLILDRRNNYDVEKISDNKNLNKYTKIFEKAKIYINYKTRIDRINSFMLENIDKDNFKNIIKNRIS